LTILQSLNTRTLRIKLVTILFLVFSNFSSFAQSYPNQPVKVISPFPPGGAADVVVRLICQKLSENMKINFIVDNKPGAGGAIGSQFVMAAEPDGYTLLLTSSSAMAINPHQMQKATYDPFTNFTAISLIGYSPNVLVVSPEFPVKNTQELIALLKTKPGAYNFASNGAGTLSHLTGDLFKQAAQVDFVIVPYKGAAPAVVDVASGQVNALFAAYASVAPMIKAGKLKPLGITSLKRISIAPNIPTLNETGMNGFESNQWWGLYGPANLPQEITLKLNAEVNKILKLPEIQKRFSEESILLLGGKPEDLTNYMRNDYNKWGKVIQAGQFKN